MVNNAKMWVDNVYLKLVRSRWSPSFPFIQIGPPGNATSDADVDVYATNVTFQGEGRGTAIAALMNQGGMSAYLDGVL